LQAGRSTSLGLQGQDGASRRLSRWLRARTMRQAFTAAGIDPDGDIMGIPETYF